jgi:hypothetical protein
MAFTRKEFLKLGLVGGAGLALSSGASASSPWGEGQDEGASAAQQGAIAEAFYDPAIRAPCPEASAHGFLGAWGASPHALLRDHAQGR